MLVFLGLILSFAAYAMDDIPAYQLDMTGSSFLSIGANPSIQSDIGSLFANPATIGYNQTPQFYVTSYKQFDAFDYTSGAYSRPYGPWNWAVGYGSVSLSEIEKTEERQVNGVNRVVSLGDFSSGWRLGYLGLSRQLDEDYMGIRDISVGASGKVYQQFIDTNDRIGYGFDVGVQGTTAISNKLIKRLDIGLSAINVGSSIEAWSLDTVTGSESFDQVVLLGVHGYHLDNKLHTYYNQNHTDGHNLGLEYYTNRSLIMRAGTNSGTGTNQVGLGFLMNELLDWGTTGYTLKLDYTYIIHPDYDAFNTHAISLSMVGDVSRKKPEIAYPPNGLKTYETTTTIGGFGSPNARILVYNDGSLTMSTQSDDQGAWQVENYALSEGSNTMTIKAFTASGKYTAMSDPVTIQADHSGPVIDIAARLVSDGLSITTQSDEPLYAIDATIDGEPIDFTEINSRYWEGVAPWVSSTVPQPVLKTAPRFELTAFDDVGNESDPVAYPLFFELKSPENNQKIAQRFVMLRGVASPLIDRLTVNQSLIPITGDNQRFEFLHLLQPGQNRLAFEATLVSGQTQQYMLDLVSVRSFDDVPAGFPEKAAIETVTSLGILSSDGNRFLPNKAISRLDFVKLLVQLNQLDTSVGLSVPFTDLTTRYSADARAIQAIITAGWMQGISNTRFGLTETITEKQAWAVFNRAAMVGLDIDPGIQDKPLTRKRLAVLLLSVNRVQAMQ